MRNRLVATDLSFFDHDQVISNLLDLTSAKPFPFIHMVFDVIANLGLIELPLLPVGPGEL